MDFNGIIWCLRYYYIFYDSYNLTCFTILKYLCFGMQSVSNCCDQNKNNSVTMGEIWNCAIFISGLRQLAIM
jgi:hypothetical protein